jgi:hypothetical protein
MDLTQAIANTTQSATMATGIITSTLDMFLQPPLVFFVGMVVVGFGFGLVKKFFRVRH